MGLLYQLKLYKFKRLWRKKNTNNGTVVKTLFNPEYVHIGNYSYGPLNIRQANIGAHLFVGNFCSIGGDVVFMLNSEHNLDYISTYPFKAKIVNKGAEATSKGNIIVDDDVWIGERSIIMSGVTIGQGAVVAAGAVVTKDVPPYAIVGGVPAKVIKFRFGEFIISELLKIDYSKLTREMIEIHMNELYEKLDDPAQLSWVPKKM